MDLRATLVELDTLLGRLAWLWRPAPFHQRRPGWCARLPALTARLLALDDARAAALADAPAELLAFLLPHVPELAEMHRLGRLPSLDSAGEAAPWQMAWGIPGRKQAQIQAFAGALGQPRAPLLEWCAGKGHLGRLLADRWSLPATSLEIDAGLCADGAALARRAGVEQTFVAGDVLDADRWSCLAARHAVALHACGDLHRALLRGAVEQGATALDLAPCCYYRTSAPGHQPYNPEAGLALSRDELHLPVTETVTAGRRDRQRRDRGMAWKLGFLALRDDLAPEREQRTFKPVPGAWLGLGFPDFCRRLAAREGLGLPAGLDPAPYEARGWQRQREVTRLGLVRLACRRPLEVWLVLDQALFLERAGYEARLGEFCARALTPRNILVSGRR